MNIYDSIKQSCFIYIFVKHILDKSRVGWTSQKLGIPTEACIERRHAHRARPKLINFLIPVSECHRRIELQLKSHSRWIADSDSIKFIRSKFLRQVKTILMIASTIL